MTDDGTRARHDYDQMADVYADDASTDPMKVAYDRPAILAMAGDVAGKRVLDLGCASGELCALLADRGADVVGVDLNPRLVERARERLGRRAVVHQADLSEPMPFLADASFDVVTASLVLHYLEKWRPPLLEIARVLGPGGILALSTHHPAHDLEIADAPASYFETVLLTDTWRKGGRDFEVRFWHRPLSAIVDSLADAGFVIERIPEPIPDGSAFESPEWYARITSVPWYLFVKAIRVADESARGGDAQ